MSIVQNPIIGRAKGQAGGMVFTTLNGQNVMKAKPNSYRDANTLTQQTNRGLHTDIVRMAAGIKDKARALFEKQPSDMPAFSKLVQQLSAAVNRSGASPVFDPAGITIGAGSFPINGKNFVYNPLTGTISVEWDALELPDSSDGEIPIHLIVFDKSTKALHYISQSEFTLSDIQADFSAHTGLVANNLRYCLVNSAKLSSGADLQKIVK